MLRILFGAVVALLPAVPIAQGAEFSGKITVVDADTLRVAGRVVRLQGIDAPEAAQTCRDAQGAVWACGRWATGEVRRRYAGRPAHCTDMGRDVHNRTLARCTVAGQDIGRALVRDGIAWAFRRYSLDYVDDEKRALFAGRGVWRGPATRPADWRAGPATRAAAPAAGCRIKGNISKNGRIYHLPGQAWYAATRISPARGERWFCTEPEARAAGWRPARR